MSVLPTVGAARWATASPITGRRWPATLFLLAMLLSACGDPAPNLAGEVVVDDVAAVTVDALSDGRLVWLDREAGTVHVQGEQSPLVTVPVDAESQGGLLGLVVDTLDRPIISWVAPGRQLTVAMVEAAGELVTIWYGVPAPSGGLGGRMVLAPNGGLVIGLGNGADLDALEVRGGALLMLDLDGPEDQVPTVISERWNNPFAFGYTPAGDLWVADNHPSDGDERLARADLGPEATQITVLPSKFASSGLAAVDDDELWICSFTTKRLDRYRINDQGVAERAGTVASDCQLDVTQLADGSVVYSTGENIKRIDPTVAGSS